MKTTKWRTPVATCGGITELVKNAYRIRENVGTEYFVDVILHAYREVGTSLECSLEIHYYDLVKVDDKYRRKVHEIKFKKWVC